VFSARSAFPREPHALAAALDELRRHGDDWLDLTEGNPTQCGFPYPHDAYAAAFADAAPIDEAQEVLAQVGLAGREWEPSVSLSYGDRRALEIGVALAARPRILFLDEPTSGLGTEETQNLARLIGRLRQRYTIVVIEHDMRFLFQIADRISVIHWGQVIAEGTPGELSTNKWVQRSALGELV